ncbi:hypothetical protein F2Q70_00030186 [Brassica cretica]|uniref:Uncharacterized protein n=1 Tax=Brassica cretica TaxID=69181 RepID=A0A8S9FFV6_BRACR|nr:hypothetical protein F2Q70_00030186 [Brassica cretica]
MRGDRFSIFREFRSFCKICLNSHGTIYRGRKNRLRLSSLDYPPRRSLRGLIENQCGVSYGMIACSDVTKGNETQKPVSRMAKI